MTEENAAQPVATVDFFKLLGETRRPWLDADLLKNKFLALSSQVHPDRFHNAPGAERAEANQRYTELNAAWQCLRDPKERLRHLLVLERGARPTDIQTAPPELTGQFFEIGSLLREAAKLAEEKARLVSPLLQAQLFGRASETTSRLMAMQERTNAQRDGLLAELRGLNTAWETPDPVARNAALPRLEEIYRLLGYFGRWSGQLQERIVQLTL